jgi:RND family efflux transporter MFP subunit
MPAPAGAPAATAPPASAPPELVEVTLTPEAVQRAGIRIGVAQVGTVPSAITAPGTVTSNAYRETKVTALIGGVVRHVAVELGQSVKRGQTLGVTFSNDLAEAQMKYLSARAMLEADHQKRERTQKLVGLGAASRQELEEVAAVHAAHEAELAAARQRLVLFGLTTEQIATLADAAAIVSELRVIAPADGVILTRSVNPGQVVGAGQELFTVGDLGTVWVIAEVYEHDLAQVRVGGEATVTGPAEPDRPVRGRVSYIDPRVDATSRTARVRVEVPNADMKLRLGMFVRVGLPGAVRRVTLVPRGAVQTVGARTVLYVPLADGEGRFGERRVTLGAPAGDLVQILAGLEPGENVVTEGSFFLRAESTRMRAGG